MKNSQKGFSLIELMIVVVIIGLLATVGVPQYQRFIAKTKQAEAKSMMSGLYTAEKAFFAEWNSYYGSFTAVGYQPDGDLTYNVGFGAAGTVAVLGHSNATFRAAPAANTFNVSGFCGLAGTSCQAKAGANGGGTGFENLPATSVVGAVNTFIIGAIADIDGDATNDIWTLDQNKTFTHTSDDVYQ